jgi:hypothetical protein
VVDELSERAADTRQTLAFGQRPRIAPSYHDDITSRRQAITVEREGLAEQALDVVALHGPAHLARDREPQPRCGDVFAAREDVEDELTAAVRAALPEDPIEVGAAR